MKPAVFSKVFSERPLEEAIDLAAEIGYDGIEIMARDPHFGVDTTDERAAEIRDRLDDSGLGMPCLATYTGYYNQHDTDEEREAQIEQLERFCELADILDCDLVRHKPGGRPLFEATDEDFEFAAEWTRRAADVAAKHDKTLGIEIHVDRVVETAASTVRFLEMVDRDNLEAIHDAGNMYIVDTDYGAESLEVLGDRLGHVHVKDELRVDDPSLPGAFEKETRRGPEVFQHQLLGEGGADHLPLFTALVERGYDGYLTDECSFPPEEVGGDVALAERELETMEELIEQARAAASQSAAD